MWSVAIKMLVGRKAKFLGLLFSLSLCVSLIATQLGILAGIRSGPLRGFKDLPNADIYIIHPSGKAMDSTLQMEMEKLNLVKKIKGVETAYPVARMLNQVLVGGELTPFEIYGIDTGTFEGFPLKILEGRKEGLRLLGGTFVGRGSSLKLGEEFSFGKGNFKVVGFYESSPSFYPNPPIVISIETFEKLFDVEKPLTFIVVKLAKGFNQEAVIQDIEKKTGLKAYSHEQFVQLQNDEFDKGGAFVSVKIVVMLATIFGICLSGQSFYGITSDNLPYFSIIQVFGGTKKTLVLIILIQALFTMFLCFSFGIFITSVLKLLLNLVPMNIQLDPLLFAYTFLGVFFIMSSSAFFSIKKLIKVEPFTILRS